MFSRTTIQRAAVATADLIGNKNKIGNSKQKTGLKWMMICEEDTTKTGKTKSRLQW